MKPLALRLVACLACATAVAPLRAEVGSKGSIAIEGRGFWPDDDDRTEDFGVALTGRLELVHKHGKWREDLRLLGRVGAIDPTRSVFIVEEGFVGYKDKKLTLRFGPQLLNWTATEAFHPADVINSRNFDSNVENADKIGEPMLSASFRMGRGRFELFYMPFRMEPLLPGSSSRLSFAPAGTALGDPLWIGRDGELGDAVTEPTQVAVRVSQTIGDADIALQFVNHQDRSQPTVALDPETGSVRPLYAMVTHFGLTWTHVLESLIVKLEAAHRRFAEPSSLGRFVPLGRLVPNDHTQVALGFEYGWSDDDGEDFTLLLEGQAVIGGDEDERAALSPFQNDVLVGLRWSANDIDATSLTTGVIFDVTRLEILGNVQYSQRLSDTWSLAAGLRVLFAEESDGPTPVGLEALDGSHHLQLTLTRHF